MLKQQGFVILVVLLAAFWYTWTNQHVDTIEDKQKAQEIIQKWKAQGEFFDYEGHSIFYIAQKTQKPTLLIFHGFPTNSWDFEPIMPDISKRFRVVIFDMLGFGFSSKPKNHKYSIIEQAEIALKLVKKLDIKEFHILAHDYGVSVAQEVIARKQRNEKGSETYNVLSVVYLNGGLFPAVHHALFTQKLLVNPIVGPYVHYVIGRRAFASSMNKIFGKAHPPTALELLVFWEFISINDGLPNFHSLLGYMQDRRDNEDRWGKAVTNPIVPTRLINGPADPVSGIHVVEYYDKVNQDKTRGGADVLAADIGHYPHVEAPEQVMHYLNIFWDKLKL